jgi:hypothetical protein
MEIAFAQPPLYRRDIRAGNEPQDARPNGPTNGHSLLREQATTAQFFHTPNGGGRRYGRTGA